MGDYYNILVYIEIQATRFGLVDPISCMILANLIQYLKGMCIPLDFFFPSSLLNIKMYGVSHNSPQECFSAHLGGKYFKISYFVVALLGNLGGCILFKTLNKTEERINSPSIRPSSVFSLTVKAIEAGWSDFPNIHVSIR